MTSVLQHFRKPVSVAGKIALIGMSAGHAALWDWGLAQVPVGARNRCLDIGCGGGASIARLLRRSSRGKIYGLDHSVVAVEQSIKRNARAIAEGRCEIVVGDATQLPYSDNQFDLVTAFETVYFWPDLDQAFQHVLRVLKPGGTFLICCESAGRDDVVKIFARRIDGMVVYTGEDLESHLAQAEFVDIEVRHHAKLPWLSVVAHKPKNDDSVPEETS